MNDLQFSKPFRKKNKNCDLYDQIGKVFDFDVLTVIIITLVHDCTVSSVVSLSIGRQIPSSVSRAGMTIRALFVSFPGVGLQRRNSLEAPEPSL